MKSKFDPTVSELSRATPSPGEDQELNFKSSAQLLAWASKLRQTFNDDLKSIGLYLFKLEQSKRMPLEQIIVVGRYLHEQLRSSKAVSSLRIGRRERSYANLALFTAQETPQSDLSGSSSTSIKAEKSEVSDQAHKP